MPEISLFYGIRVTMYYEDHNPPHFHAEYNGNKAIVDIIEARVIKGALPSRQLKLILAWCVIHQDKLMQNWELSKDGLPLNRINPLVQEADMFYDIVQVIPNEDYTVYVYFEDGKIVCYDAKTLLKKKVFEPLKDINFFMNACTILNGTLAWDVTGTRDCSKCLDIDPEMLYGLENVSEKIA